MQISTETIQELPFPMNYDFHRGDTLYEKNKVMAERTFNENELVFAGHFPKNKILPGVMLVEYALYLGKEYIRKNGNEYTLSEILSARFLAPVLPGMNVKCSCEFENDEKSNLLSMKATLSRDNTICARIKVKYAGRRL